MRNGDLVMTLNSYLFGTGVMQAASHPTAGRVIVVAIASVIYGAILTRYVAWVVRRAK
jgi:hypothetical protein